MPKNAVVPVDLPDTSSTRPPGLTVAAGSTITTTRPPAIPPLPPSLKSVLGYGLKPVFGEHGFNGYAEDVTWQPPALSDPAERQAVADAIRFYEAELLAPGDPLLIAGRVRTLLAHWRDREMDRALLDAVNEDWMRVLSRYPLWVVCAACEEWLEVSRQRPTIAEIRLLCDQAVKQHRLELRVLRKLAAAQSAPDAVLQRPDRD
jgi:hypothetical protein